MSNEEVKAKRAATLCIGIDPGTNTGYAVWDRHTRAFTTVETLNVFNALKRVVDLHEAGTNIFVRIEDARLRTWFEENTGPEKWKGAGSIRRDCNIWEEVMNQYKIPYEFVHPRHVRATTSAFFASISGWKKRTSKHAREAAYMVLNM